jgi:hypothetical protein
MTLTFEQLDAVRGSLSAEAAAAMHRDPGTIAAFRARGHRELEQHRALFARYQNHLANPDCRNTLPWHALGERTYVQAVLLNMAEGDDRTDLLPPHPLGRAGLGAILSGMIGTAAVYQWREDMETLAASAPLPTHRISRDILPFPSMFWSREVARESYLAADGPAFETNWFFVWDAGDRFCVNLDLLSNSGGNQRLTLMTLFVPYGRQWPDDFTEIDRTGVERVLQMLSFINSPFVASDEETGLPRAIRRDLERHAPVGDGGIPPEVVRVVTLRRPAKPREAAPTDGEPSHQHQWWVRGHHRAQWYPSQQTHKVIWIRPHLKGDPSLPLLTKVYRVAK